MRQRVFGLVGVGLLLLLSTSSLAGEPARKHVVLHPSAMRDSFPFSDAVLVGNTLYVAGTVGFEPGTGKPPASAETGNHCDGRFEASHRKRRHDDG